MPRVFVEPVGLHLDVPEEETLFNALVARPWRSAPTAPAAAPAASAWCASAPAELSEHTSRELKRIPEKLRDEGWRLACQAYPRGARVSIEVRGTAGQRRILTTSKLHHGKPHPAVVTRHVELEPATLEDARSDLERFDEALGGVEVAAQRPRLPAQDVCATASGRSTRRCTASA